KPRYSDTGILRCSQQLAQNVGEDSAMSVVIHLDRGIDAQLERDLLGLAVLARKLNPHFLHRRNAFLETQKVDGLRPIELQSMSVGAFLELEQQYTHEDEVRTVDALEVADYNCFNAEQQRTFSGPIA